MVKWLIAAVVAVVLATVIYNMASGKETLSVGISASAPLGDYEKVEAHLAGKGLNKTDFDKDGVNLFFGEGRFKDHEPITQVKYVDTVPGAQVYAVLVRGKTGKLVGLASKFRSGSKDFSIQGPKVDRFTALYWLQIAGQPPEYRSLMEGGSDAPDYLLAEGQRNGAKCTWRKDGQGGPKSMSHSMHDTVVFAVQ